MEKFQLSKEAMASASSRVMQLLGTVSFIVYLIDLSRAFLSLSDRHSS
jgi:hypothetical protein